MGQIKSVFRLVLIWFIPVVFMWAFVEHAIIFIRGYNHIIFKSRMYWDGPRAVKGDKVKKWELAVPRAIGIRGSLASYLLFAKLWPFEENPPYTTDREDMDNYRGLILNTDVMPDNTLVSGANLDRKVEAIGFGLRITNKPLFALGQQFPAKPDGCIVWKWSSGVFPKPDIYVDYHGWSVKILLSPLEPAPSVDRICAIVYSNMDRWTLHIDDLHVKDSGK